MSPILADVDGDHRDEVAIAVFTGQPELYGGDGTRRVSYTTLGRGARSDASAPGTLALGANAAFGRTTPGGPLRLIGGMVDNRLIEAQSSPGQAIPFEHVLGGWDAAGGGWLSAFPRVMEGWLIVTAPTLADVDGDGNAEILSGSSGDVLHAFHEDGTEPAGWPKDLGGWLLAAPTVGDVDATGAARSSPSRATASCTSSTRRPPVGARVAGVPPRRAEHRPLPLAHANVPMLGP